MSNKKFSEFTLQTDSSNVAFVVGFNGSDNVRISPSNLIGSGFLPTSGGTMTGNLLLQDNIQVQVGTGGDLKIFHNGTDSFIENQTGILKIQSSVVDGDISFLADNGSGTATEYFKLSGSSSRVQFSKNQWLTDNVKILIGNNDDLEIYHDASNSYIQQTGTGDLIIENTTDDKDIKLKSDDGSGGTEIYINVDGSARATKFVNPTFHNDSVKAKFGSDGDLEIYHDGHSRIENNVGDFVIQTNLDDGDIKFRADDGSGGIAEYFRVDGGNEHVVYSKPTIFSDNIALKFGDGIDLQIESDGSNGKITNNIGDLYIINSADDETIFFQNDDGSGGVTTYFEIQGSNTRTVFRKTLNLQDTVDLYLGTSSDLRLVHNGSDSIISNATGNLTISNSADDSDIIFQSEDGSGGVTTYFTVDGSARDVVFNKDIHLNDNVKLLTGTGQDFKIFHDGTDTKIENETGDLFISQFANDKDIIFRNDDGSGNFTEYFRLDGGVIETTFSKDLRIIDNEKLILGTSNDLELFHNGTNTVFNAYNGNLSITNFADDKDIIFSSDDGSGGTTEYFRLDGSLASGGSVFTVFPDNSSIVLGTGNDLQAKHNGTDTTFDNFSGDLKFQNYADDKDIVFSSDDGSGGLAEYFRLDGTNEVNKFSKNVQFLDNVSAMFGNGADLLISSNGSSGLINNLIGDLTIQTSTDDGDIIFKSDDGSGGVETYFRLDGSANSDGNPRTIFPDNAILALGTSQDFTVQHNATNTELVNLTGNLNIKNSSTDGDISFFGDNASGGVMEYFRLDGADVKLYASVDLKFNDSVSASFGNNDLLIQHNGTKSLINNYTGDLEISNFADDSDIKFICDDGSGGTTTYMMLDGSVVQTRFLQNLRVDDSKYALFGNSNDLEIRHNGTNSEIFNNTGNLTIGNRADDKDIIFQSDDGSGSTTTYFKLDGATSKTIFETSSRHKDNVKANFGDGEDLQIYHDGSNSFIDNVVGNLNIQNNGDDVDIVFRADDGSGGLTTYFQLDGSQTRTLVSKNLDLLDNVRLRLGTGDAADQQDLQIYHDGTNSQIKNFTGDLKIEVSSDDKDIVFRGDDGLGGITTYVQLDGSEVSTKIFTQKVIMSNLPTSDPSNSGQLYNDGGVLKVSAG